MKVRKNPVEEPGIEDLNRKLTEANDTIEAIRSGKVDALVVKGEKGSQIFTLKTSDQTYRVFIEKMIEGAVTLNKKGNVLYCNLRFAKMLKLPLEKIIGSDFKNFVSSDPTKTIDQLIKKGWKEECKGETCLITDDKEFIPVLVSLTTLDLDEGTALSLVLTDLTAQKNIEKELREKNEALKAAQTLAWQLNNELEQRVNERTRELLTSREHFKFLADTIPVIVWKALPNGNLEYFNRRWYDYTGKTFEESKDHGWESVTHPDDLENMRSAWSRSLTTGEPLKIETRKRSVHGEYRWHITNALPFRDNDGNMIAWFGVCTDIEDQKMDMKKKDEFISMASHELKTPVTSLKAYTQMVMMKFAKEENVAGLGVLAKMDNQIDKLTRLIGDLLDASKANSGQLNFNYEKIDFNELVKEAADTMQFMSPRHKIELNLNDTRTIKGDKSRLGQVIINLLSNAIKYSPNADKIVVSSHNNKNSIRFCVQDFGIGIPLSQQSKLFSRFFRVTENTYPGLGLGLYISSEIIKRHSGTMDFKSEEGKGSVFCFSLPVLAG
jgi:two-component system CheB/CheR fusion protein